MKTYAWLVAATVVAMLLGDVGCISISGAQELSQTEVQHQDNWTYTSNFLSRDGAREAVAYLNVGGSDNICSVKLEIWHEEGTTLDELSLEFNPLQLPEALALVATGASSVLAKLQQEPDGTGVKYSLPDTGFQGCCTMVFEFLIRKDILGSVSSPEDQMRLHIDFTMHKGGTFSKTTQHGEGDIYFQIP